MGVSWSITRARAGKPVSRLRRGSVEFYIFPDSAFGAGAVCVPARITPIKSNKKRRDSSVAQ
jgi:hypothetical protein